MQSLTRHFAAITQKVFERHGFASLDLAAQWPVIAGEGSAHKAKPEKINWPHKTLNGHKQGGTLVLRAPAELALDIHYETPRLIERVNQYLGYAAIAAIKVVPAAANEAAPRPIPRRAVPQPEIRLPEMAEENLSAALSRLGSAIAAESAKPRSSPQGKSKV